jgi:regulatory protein
MPTITALTQQKRNQERVNVHLDGEFAFGLNIVDAAGLRTGQDLSDAQIAELRDKDAVVQAVDRAVRFLSYRPRSIQEVRQNLEKHDTPPAVIDAAIERLIQLRYVDDEQFARFWVENRDNFKPRGAIALRQELRQKGIDNALVDAVLDDLLDEADAAYRAASARSQRYAGSSKQVFKHKLGGFLQRRGFSYRQTSQAITQLIEDLEANDPDFFMTETQDTD